MTVINNFLRNQEAEDAVLGIALNEGNTALNEIRDVLTEKDFSGVEGALYVEICRQSDDGIKYDILTISEKIGPHLNIDRSYLLRLINSAPTFGNLSYYTKIVKDCSMRRQKMNQMKDFERQIMEGGDIREIISCEMIADMDLIKSDSRDRVKPLREVIQETYDQIETRMGKDYIGIPTGIKPFDTITSGMISDCVMTIAGRPGTGKTTFVQQILRNISREYATCICSMEMKGVRLGVKFLANESGINSRLLDTPSKMKDEHWNKAAYAAGKLSELELYVDDSVEMKASQIAIRARKLKSKVDFKVLAIDYIQLIQAEDESKRESRHSQITKSMQIFKHLARELNITVIILSQITREIEKREHQKPNMADLKESGSLEEMSDVIAFLYKDDESKKKTAAFNHDDWEVTSVNVAKNKYGPADVTIDLLFQKDFSRFMTMDFEHEPPKFNPVPKQKAAGMPW